RPHDLVLVRLHRAWRQVEGRGDLSRTVTPRDELQDLALSGSQGGEGWFAGGYARHALGNMWTDIRATLQHDTNRREQLLTGALLRHERHRSRCDGLLLGPRIAVHRDDYDLGDHTGASKLTDRFDSAQPRHRE